MERSVMNKRGISPIIATVLILIITFVAISILAVFVIPFVSENLEGSEECINTLGDVKFDETPYNCYVDGGDKNRTGFSVRVNGEEVAGIKVSLFKDGTSEVMEIMNGTDGNSLGIKIRMLSSGFDTKLNVPSKGGVRTYVADGLFDELEVNAILKSGKLCDVSDSIRVNTCLDNDARQSLLAY